MAKITGNRLHNHPGAKSALKMQTDDLFSFLEEEDSNIQTISETAVGKNGSSQNKKRKVEGAKDTNEKTTPTTTPQPTAIQIDEIVREDAGPAAKKPRLGSPRPLVVDEFETEAKREVAASAGLSDSIEAGQRLELRHQVSSCRC